MKDLCTMPILTEINIDCLESIFDRLNFIDLLNIADTSSSLKGAAELVFARKYGKQKFWLDLDHHCSIPTLCEQQNVIKISDSKTCLQILRCFGEKICNLHLIGDKFIPSTREMNHIIRLLDYVKKFCRKSVKKITFEKFSAIVLSHINDEFSNVEKVHFKYCCVEKTLNHFNRLFPSARSLELLWTDVGGTKLHIPNLEELEINIPISLNRFQMENIKAIVESNQQLKCLKIYIGWDREFLQNISKQLKSVNSLEIGYTFNDLHQFDDKVIHFNSVHHFTLRSNGPAVAPKIIFSFDLLEEFTLETNCWWNEENISLVSMHKSITKLIIKSEDSAFRVTVNESIAMKMANALPALREIHIGYKEFSANEAIHLLNEFKLMEKLCFKLDKRVEFDGLVRRTGQKWQAKIDERNFIQMERHI